MSKRERETILYFWQTDEIRTYEEVPYFFELLDLLLIEVSEDVGSRSLGLLTFGLRLKRDK